MTATRHEQLAAEIGLKESVSIVSVDEFGVEHEYRQPSLSERSPDELGEWSATIQSLRIECDAWHLRAETAEAKLDAIYRLLHKP